MHTPKITELRRNGQLTAISIFQDVIKGKIVLTNRELVIQHVTERMIKAFVKGEVPDAQNLEAFISTLEGMSDASYEALVTEIEPSEVA